MRRGLREVLHPQTCGRTDPHAHCIGCGGAISPGLLVCVDDYDNCEGALDAEEGR